MSRVKYFSFFALIIILCLFWSRQSSSYQIISAYSHQEENKLLKVHQSSQISIPRVDDSNVIIDGLISVDEYEESYLDPTTNIIAFWEHNNSNLTVGLVSSGIGWVSLLIGDQMYESNMIMGGIKNGITYALDLVGTGGYFPGHGNDTDNGGFYDILEAAASENSTHTIFEFIIPFNSTDPLDPVLEENEILSMYFAYHATSDNIITGHTAHTFDALQVLIRPSFPTIDTFMSFSVVTEIEQGETLKFNAILTNKSLDPLINMKIDFFLKTQFGKFIIDSVNTNNTGGANATYYHPTLSGNFTFGVKFDELIINNTGKEVVYKSSEDTQNVNIVENIKIITDPIRTLIGFLGFTFASVALIIVWGFYAFNFLLLVSFLINKKEKAGNMKQLDQITENR